MNVYESILILKDDCVINSEYKFTNLLKEKNALAVIGCEIIGKRNLAYEIQGYKEGVFMRLEFMTDSETLEKYERFCRADDNVLKFIVVRLDS